MGCLYGWHRSIRGIYQSLKVVTPGVRNMRVSVFQLSFSKCMQHSIRYFGEGQLNIALEVNDDRYAYAGLCRIRLPGLHRRTRRFRWMQPLRSHVQQIHDPAAQGCQEDPRSGHPSPPLLVQMGGDEVVRQGMSYLSWNYDSPGVRSRSSRPLPTSTVMTMS